MEGFLHMRRFMLFKRLLVCRPYHGSLFWTHKSLLTDTAAVAFQPKERWNSIRIYWEHIPKALPPLFTTRGTSPDVCNNDRPQKNQPEMSNLEVRVGLLNTQGEKRIAAMEIVGESPPVWTNVRIIHIASHLDSYDWCLHWDVFGQQCGLMGCLPVSNGTVVSAKFMLSGGPRILPSHSLLSPKLINPAWVRERNLPEPMSYFSFPVCIPSSQLTQVHQHKALRAVHIYNKYNTEKPQMQKFSSAWPGAVNPGAEH